MGKKLQKKNKNPNHMHNPSVNERRNKPNSDTAPNDQKYLIEVELWNRFSVLEEESDDLISSLPDDILLRIISFLPSHSAVIMRALSTQWNNLWLCSATLIKHGYQPDIALAITKFLNQFHSRNSLKKFQRLQFHFGKCQILLAFVGRNWKLHLDFSKLKENVFDFSKVKGDVLGECCWLQLDNCYIINKLSPSLSFVKALTLTSMNYYPTYDTVTCISKLELLESLVIERCNAVQYLCIRNVPKLQNIIVLDCPQLRGIYIEASELGSLRIRGKLTPCICFQDNFSLNDAMLDIREGPDYKYLECECFCPPLQKINFANKLTLCRWTFENFLLQTTCKNWLHTVPFYHLTDLWWIDSSVEEQNIDALFSFLNICPHLERLFITIDPTCCGMRSTIAKPPRYKKRLKVVKLENLTDGEGVVFLAENLLETFVVENLVIVASDGNYLRSLVKVPLKGATRKGKCYKFVEDNSGLRLKHAHMCL